jgi:small subunit ribosomal protein S8e
MPQWHGDEHKRKRTGGKKHTYRTKRAYEMGSNPTETRLGKLLTRINRVHGGNLKLRMLAGNYANVTNPATGETKKVEILEVVENPANVDYDRRGVITKGAIIRTPLGQARVTSRPGQDGIVNALLIKSAES